MTTFRPLLVFILGLCWASAVFGQYPGQSSLTGNSPRQLPAPPASGGSAPKESPARQPQYSYGQFGPSGQVGPQQQQLQQQYQPSSGFGATTNTNPIRHPNSNNPAENSLSAKLEQKLRPQSLQQQSQQQQRFPSSRYDSNSGTGGSYGSSGTSGGYGSSNSGYGSGVGGYVGAGGSGVNIQVQLKAYANPERQIGPGRLCSCPPASQDCINKSPSRAGYFCIFSFTVVVTSNDAVVHRRSTPFLLLNANGQIAQDGLASLQRPIDFQLDGEPSSINVFVTSLGAVLDTAGNVEEWNTVSEVDTFVKQLRDGATGSVGGYSSGDSSGSYQQPQQVNLVGTQLGTQLSLTYTVSCRNARLVGPGCDLSCNRSAVNSGNAICVSARTGYFSLCRWTGNAANSQVSECKNCPWGIEENAYCRDENGGVLEANHAGVVSDGYQTATIILAILAGLLAFCVLVICVYTKARMPKKGQTSTKSKSRTPPAYSSSAGPPPAAGQTIYLKHGGEPEQITTTTAAGAPLPPRSGHAGQHYLPPLPPNGKAKASLRSPLLFPMPPPPHSLNDTMNSSFTGSQAPIAPPSVSADV